MKNIIKAYWSEDYCNTDGFYIVNYPDECDFKNTIIEAQSLLECCKDCDDINYVKVNYNTALNMFSIDIDKEFECLQTFYEMHNNCSLSTTLDFICGRLKGWSYEEPENVAYDLDYLKFYQGE